MILSRSVAARAHIRHSHQRHGLQQRQRALLSRGPQDSQLAMQCTLAHRYAAASSCHGSGEMQST